MKRRGVPVDQYDPPQQPPDTDCCDDGWVSEADDFEIDEETGRAYVAGYGRYPCPDCNPDGDE